MATLRTADCYGNPGQPRKTFEPTALAELAASISERGLLQPITVRADGTGRYMVVAGERRLRAHVLAGMATIEANVVTMADDDLADAAIVENLQRSDISPLEEAKAFQSRLDTGLSVDALAKRLGIKQAWRITERTALLALGPEMQLALSAGILSPTQAREMARLSAKGQDALWRALKSGQCPTEKQLKATVQALLQAEKQVCMFPADIGPSDEDKEAMTQFEKAVGRMVELCQGGFDSNHCIVMTRINRTRAGVLAQELELIRDAVGEMITTIRAEKSARALRVA